MATARRCTGLTEVLSQCRATGSTTPRQRLRQSWRSPPSCWRRLFVRLEGEAWSRYFRDFQRSAFRLELRPFYTMPGEADELRRVKAGEKPPADYHYGWLDTMAA